MYISQYVQSNIQPKERNKIWTANFDQTKTTRNIVGNASQQYQDLEDLLSKVQIS